ncbi:MAG TPA: ribosomal protein S18-alanine N-acetyltransferase [Mycobacteriales bacterium]|jgi:ribosomal-protein-alanine N-acetyltransferase|nr:ribosomal protein S18-alanine N-acetyltransferase [Mycobacteriales bacterium]
MAATSDPPLTPLRWWEIEELLPIEQELFGDEQWSAAMFWSELAQSDSRWYRVARSELGELVGYVGVCVYGADQAWIQTLGVRRDSQRRGLGGGLVSAAIDHARSAGVPQLALEVRADNADAQRLYARHDFDVIGVRRGYYQPSGVDALVMAREFAAADRQ